MNTTIRAVGTPQEKYRVVLTETRGGNDRRQHDRAVTFRVYWRADGTAEVPQATADALVATGHAVAETVSDPGLLSGSGLPAVVDVEPDPTLPIPKFPDEQPFGQAVEAPKRRGKR